MVNSSKFSVISLFSGCGGMDLGFSGGFEFLGEHYDKNPFDIVWANDINGAACKTYRENIGGHIIEGDVWDALGKLPKTADLIIGGFPCQDISVNGKGAGIDGKKSGLYLAIVRAVEKVRPKLFVVENVKGLLMKHNASSLERIMRDFHALGYDVNYRLYRAIDYGVPQTRERVIFVGTREDMPKFVHPEPPQNSKHITAKEAIGDLEVLEKNEAFSHIWSLANKSAGQGNGKLKADRPGYTIRAECHGNIQFHYKLPRRISMREAARFQSFPDSFKFFSKLRETERQIGNAVPPILAWHIADSIQKFMVSASRLEQNRL